MKMYKLTYEYFYMGGDQIKSALGYFDDETKALEAWEKCFNRENCKKEEGIIFSPNAEIDDAKREYTFSCCGWREWYRLEEFEHDNRVSSWGGGEEQINTVNMEIKEAVKKLADLSSHIKRQSLNYSKSKPADYSHTEPIVLEGAKIGS